MNKKLKVAVIDSGCNIEYSLFQNSNIQIVDLTKSNYVADVTGHGTAMCSEIVNFMNNANIIVFKIFENEDICSLKLLIAALEYCIKDPEIKLINLSLATEITDIEVINYLNQMVDELYSQEKIVICAMSNYLESSYLSCLSKVIGVKFHYNPFSSEEFYRYDSSKNNCTYFSPVRLVPSCKKKFKFNRGNSAASAKMTGLVAQWIENDQENKNMKLKLEEYESNTIYGAPDTCVMRYEYITLDELAKCIMELVPVQNFGDWKNDLSHFLSQEQSIQLLYKIEQKKAVKLNFLKFTSFDFLTVCNLHKKVNLSVILQ